MVHTMNLVGLFRVICRRRYHVVARRGISSSVGALHLIHLCYYYHYHYHNYQQTFWNLDSISCTILLIEILLQDPFYLFIVMTTIQLVFVVLFLIFLMRFVD